MKSLSAMLLALVSVLASTLLAPRAVPGTVRVDLVLVGNKTGGPVAGVVLSRDADGASVELPSRLSRAWGLLSDTEAIGTWSVVPGRVQVELPRTRLTIEAVSGIESERSVVQLDLGDGAA